MAENRVEANAHNAGGCPASNAIHGHINDFLVRTGLRGGVCGVSLEIGNYCTFSDLFTK